MKIAPLGRNQALSKRYSPTMSIIEPRKLHYTSSGDADCEHCVLQTAIAAIGFAS
jgi:hypothetical protein